MTDTTKPLSPLGKKFYADGTVREFPGNTIICPMRADMPAYQKCVWVCEQLQAQPFAHHFTLLPPSSFHMTVIQLLCDQDREPEKWSSRLAPDSTMEEIDVFFLEVVPKIRRPGNFRMVYQRLKTHGASIGILLQPLDETTRQALIQYRDAIAEVTGVRRRDHMHYAFHISLAYQIDDLNDEEKAHLNAFAEKIDRELSHTFGVYNTSAPELVFFDDMLKFVPASERHTLKTRGQSS